MLDYGWLAARLDGGNHTDAVEGFATRLARRLVEVYTAPHDTVADFDSDTHLDAATHATARTYLNLAGPASLPTGASSPTEQP